MTRDWHDRQPGVPYEARPGLTYYKQLGYIPVDKTAESASETLEDAYDDYAVAQVARAVGRKADYRFFVNRAHNYRNIYNSARGFMQAKHADGSWARPKEGWTEGDQWVYTYSVLHDIPGLMALMGGPDKFNARLDEHFQGGHNQHDNEPSHHYAYLYDFSGQPWKTQLRVREIADRYYKNRPDGVVSAPASSAANLYIQSARLNGRPLDVPIVTYAQIEAGGLLRHGTESVAVGFRTEGNPPGCIAAVAAPAWGAPHEGRAAGAGTANCSVCRVAAHLKLPWKSAGRAANSKRIINGKGAPVLRRFPRPALHAGRRLRPGLTGRG